MFQILVLSHGDFSRELVKSAELIVGEQHEGIIPLCLPLNQDMEEYYREIEQHVLKSEGKGGTLILTDIMGGSTFITAAKIYRMLHSQIPVEIVTGVNLPMLIEVLGCRESGSLEQGKQIALTEGVCGIQDFSARLQKSS
ncbi:PTS sugar transporter subunit IIA [Oscillospiraceae bacterium PP1C4]